MRLEFFPSNICCSWDSNPCQYSCTFNRDLFRILYRLTAKKVYLYRPSVWTFPVLTNNEGPSTACQRKNNSFSVPRWQLRVNKVSHFVAKWQLKGSSKIWNLKLGDAFTHWIKNGSKRSRVGLFKKYFNLTEANFFSWLSPRSEIEAFIKCSVWFTVTQIIGSTNNNMH